MERHAHIDGTGLYRYALTRRWAKGGQAVLWVMLNPSTADGQVDDRTLCRIIDFSQRWYYSALGVVNLYALRATNPDDLRDSLEAGVDPVGDLNDAWITMMARRADEIMVAWGAHPDVTPHRKLDVTRILRDPRRRGFPPRTLHALRLTKDGSPGHPLYCPADVIPVEWTP